MTISIYGTLLMHKEKIYNINENVNCPSTHIHLKLQKTGQNMLSQAGFELASLGIKTAAKIQIPPLHIFL